MVDFRMMIYIKSEILIYSLTTLRKIIIFVMYEIHLSAPYIMSLSMEIGLIIYFNGSLNVGIYS